jgi:hypothetical protein
VFGFLFVTVESKGGAHTLFDMKNVPMCGREHRAYHVRRLTPSVRLHKGTIFILTAPAPQNPTGKFIVTHFAIGVWFKQIFVVVELSARLSSYYREVVSYKFQ